MITVIEGKPVGATRFTGFLYAFAPGTTYQQERMDKQVSLQGGYYWVRGATVGDRVTLSVVDVDNVLGGGTDVVVSEYVRHMPVAPWDNQQEILSPTTAEILAGLYLRITYTNTGSGTVDLGVTYRWFEI